MPIIKAPTSLRPARFRAKNPAKGFTLLEVLVALVIFSVGLLGLAGIQAVSLQNNGIAYSQTVAMQSAYDMADILRASANFDNNIDNTFDNISSTLGSEPTSCAQSGGTVPTCTTTQMASHQVYFWKYHLSQNLPLGRGTVERNGDIYTITIMWDEARTGATGEDCGDDPEVDLKCYTLDIQI